MFLSWSLTFFYSASKKKCGVICNNEKTLFENSLFSIKYLEVGSTSDYIDLHFFLL